MQAWVEYIWGQYTVSDNFIPLYNLYFISVIELKFEKNI